MEAFNVRTGQPAEEGILLQIRAHCLSASNSTNSTEDAEVDDTVSFPNHLYSQASKASAEDKVAFTVQILEEMVALLEGGYSSASWEENTEENFLSVVSRQAVGLRSCTVHHKESKKLHMYFKRLSSHVLEQMGHSAEAWELIRREMKSHLKRVDQLLLSNQHLSVTFIYYLDVAGIAVEMEAISSDDVTKREDIEDEKERTKHRTLGDALGQRSGRGGAVIDMDELLSVGEI
uniref:uncharacterized protein LOC117247002 n=1 Tax=Epinephelus lanceolatus TaxID=310571 RepID=UPI001447F893|nr:uncharacterized protein LOC117247002 [Epinephelus lanceolatus]